MPQILLQDSGPAPFPDDAKWLHYIHPALEHYALDLLSFFKQAEVEKYFLGSQTDDLYTVLSVAAGFVRPTSFCQLL
jgi:hypothetical protein